MKRLRIAMVIGLVLLLGACSGSGGGATALREDAAGGPQPVSGGGAESAGLGQDVAAAKGAGASGAGDVEAEAPELEPLPDSTLANQRIIKEGTISVEVGEDKFDAAFQRVIAAARALGGDVIGSSTRTSDEGDTFGSVTVRVPVEDFEDLLVDVGGVGTVRNRNIHSQDVSAEYTDLESRLRHLEALERFYLGLFDDAKNVQDAIAVQQRLDTVQGQIEKAQGRLNLLDDRTSFSTLTVEIFEPGAGSVIAEDTPADRPTLARYWDTARDAFVNVVGAMLVVVLFVLPLLVPLALLGAAWLALRRRRRSGAVVPVVEEPEPTHEDRVGADH